MTTPTSLGRVAAACLLAAPLVAGLGAQAPAATASATKVAELTALFEARKLEAYAMKDPRAGKADRYIAALLVPKSQLLLVTATHSRFMDVEYFLHNKDFMKAYVDLNTSTFSVDRFFVEDVMADGLVALPKRNSPPDAVKIGDQATQSFDGDFADPRRRNQGTKITQEAYLKTFGEADQRYAEVLALIVEQLKKGSTSLGSLR